MKINPLGRAAAFAVAFATVLAFSGTAFAHVQTDQPDYAPGSVVTISGDNSDGAQYLAGETVHVDVAGPNDYASSCEGTADDTGAWSCQVTLVDGIDAIGEYTYTATGQSSGETESGTFQDSMCPNPNQIASYKQAAFPLAASFSTSGTTATYSFGASPRSAPGLAEYCVYTSPNPTSSHATFDSWISGSRFAGEFDFGPGTFVTRVPFDGVTRTIGTATFSGGVPGAQTILLHIVDHDQCVALYGQQQTTADCFVYPSGGSSPNLSVTKTAQGTYDDNFTWSITKGSDKDLVTQNGGSATFTYTVKVTPDAGTPGNYQVTGTITVTNPTPGTPVAIAGVTDSLSDGTICSVTGGGSQVLTQAQTDFPYACTLNSAPQGQIDNTATVSWPDQVSGGTHLSAGSASFTFNAVPFSPHVLNDCGNVIDEFNGGSADQLGHVCKDGSGDHFNDNNLPNFSAHYDPNDQSWTFMYSRSIPIPDSGCQGYSNLAIISSTTGPNGPNGPLHHDSHTVTVCFAPAGLKITKTADAPVVNAGDPIGFTITLTSTGPGDAVNTTLTDPLPGGTGINWSIASQSGPATCSITGTPPNQTLGCGTFTLPAGHSETVHVTSQTNAGSCGTYDNTATYTSGNGDTSSASASITVNCPKLSITKTADAPSVNPGQPIGFTITVSNAGPGTAKNVTLNDPLPGGSGINWSINPAYAGPGSCSITGTAPNQTLNCSFGDLAAGASVSVHVTSPTTAQGCGTYKNTAFANAANAPSPVQAQASTTVTCPAKTGALTMGFWQNKNGQGIITSGASTKNVCNSGTWLRQYKPFQDLSSTATCTNVASYVYNVIKAANAGGASMNAMLKAQMLATALDVYFSDPALGGNQIKAPSPIGAQRINLTSICTMKDNTDGSATCTGAYVNAGPAFGGATCLTVSQTLAYAAGQSDVGGNTWYGNVKSTQALAKNTFDSINNQIAFNC